jgi:hypothetical protein
VNGTVLGWIMNQARSRAIDRLRFESRRKRSHDGDVDILVEVTADPRDVLELREQGELLRAALAVLTRSGAGLDQRRGGSMLYIVEVVTTGDLASELSQMRTWLDHMKCQAIDFKKMPSTNTCRVGFANEQEAGRFAHAFAGQMLYRSAA